MRVLGTELRSAMGYNKVRIGGWSGSLGRVSMEARREGDSLGLLRRGGGTQAGLGHKGDLLDAHRTSSGMAGSRGSSHALGS